MRQLVLGTVAFLCASLLPLSPAQAQQLGALPATFKGDLPCADCIAIQYQLDLFADNTYDLSMIYRGKSGAGINQSGRWELSGRSSITLHNGRNAEMKFDVESANSLRLLNQDGSSIASRLNYTLTRDVQTPSATLTNTSWRLTRLRNEPARRFENQREPQIVLQGEGRVAGSDGCNRITGSYRQSGLALTFGQMASTQMACINGMEQAARFTQALSEVARYRIAGRHLELLDAADALLMRFEAVFVR